MAVTEIEKRKETKVTKKISQSIGTTKLSIFSLFCLIRYNWLFLTKQFSPGKLFRRNPKIKGAY